MQCWSSSDLQYLGPQPETSWSCKTTNVGPAYCVVCLFSPSFWMTLLGYRGNGVWKPCPRFLCSSILAVNSFSALILLVGRQEGHLTCKKLVEGLLVMIWLELFASYSSRCHHYLRRPWLPIKPEWKHNPDQPGKWPEWERGRDGMERGRQWGREREKERERERERERGERGEREERASCLGVEPAVNVNATPKRGHTGKSQPAALTNLGHVTPF